MNAQEFVDLLSTLNILNAGAIEVLRGQAQVGNNQLTPQQILKSLLDDGQVTRDQAKLVVAKLQQSETHGKVPWLPLVQIAEQDVTVPF